MHYASLVLALASVFTINAFAEKNPVLPPPFETPSTQKPATVIGWPEGVMPQAPVGYTVTLFADIEAPRSLFRMPNGDVAVSQANARDKANSPDKITVFKIDDQKNVSDVAVLAENLELPFGMAAWENEFFVAEPTRILKYTLEDGKIAGEPVVIATLPFPAPQRHWTRHLLMKNDGTKLYAAVGSASNVGEDGDPLDPMTAAIVEMNRDGSEMRVFAGGLRNPVQIAWHPETGALWATVNERDELGDGLVPDYITAVQDGGFYGWPYAYWGQNEDPRRAGERPDLVAATLVPNYSMGAHVAALGLTFTMGTNVAVPFNAGALVSEHGSWNSSKLVGYKVAYVPFVNGDAIDGEMDFLTGFIANEETGEVYGRPVASLVLDDGSVLVTDDGAGKIWKVSLNPTFFRGISVIQ